MDILSGNRKKTALWIIGIVAVCSLIFLGVQNIKSVVAAIVWCIELVLPLVIGIGFAVVLDVPLKFFERHLFTKTKKPHLLRLRRPVAFVISLTIILGIVVGVVALVIPELIEAIRVIVQIVIDFVNKLLAMEESELLALPFGEYLVNADWQEMLSSVLSWLKNQGGNIVNTAFGVVGTVVDGVIDVGVALVFGGYVLFHKDKLKRQCTRLVYAWLPHKAGNAVIYTVKLANENFRNFITGQTLEAMILGVLCMTGMLILQIPYAPMVGALVGVTAMIPVIGGFIGAGVGAVMILTISPVKALIFLVFLIVLQQIEGNFIYPKVMGNRVKLPSIWIFAAVAVGGSVAGPIGMFLSVPVASTLYCLVREFTFKREQRLEAVSSDSPEETEDVTAAAEE